jgi:integrase
MGVLNKGPHLEKNDRGVWEIRWTENRRSNRLSTRTGDRSEAEAALAAYLVAKHAEEKLTAGALTIDGVLDYYLDMKVEKGKIVAKFRQRDIAKNLRPHFGKYYPHELTPDVIESYKAARGPCRPFIDDNGKTRECRIGTRPARSDGTLRRELNMLTSALNFAVDKRHPGIDGTKIPHIDLPASPPPKDLWFDEDEADQLLDAASRCSDRGRLFVSIALATASRRAAIETLKWSQVDLKAGLIHFNPPGRIQSAKRRVPVPISDDLMPVLVQARAQATTEYVMGHAGRATRAFQVVIARAFKETGNKKFLQATPHTLRHTWATLAARAGADMYEIAGVLGDTLESVTKNYLHHCPEHLRRTVNLRRAKTSGVRKPRAVA